MCSNHFDLMCSQTCTKHPFERISCYFAGQRARVAFRPARFIIIRRGATSNRRWSASRRVSRPTCAAIWHGRSASRRSCAFAARRASPFRSAIFKYCIFLIHRLHILLYTYMFSNPYTWQTFFGNMFVRSTDLLNLANVSPDQSFALHLKIDETLEVGTNMAIQCALLYTSSRGEPFFTLCVHVRASKIGQCTCVYD